MDLKTRNDKITEYWQEQREILNRKGADYTGGKLADNANSNFDEVARRLAGAVMSPLTVWAVYWEKQIIAIETFVRTGRLESEGIAGRFNDVANYTNIGRTIVESRQETPTPFFIVCPSCKTRFHSKEQLSIEPGEFNQKKLVCSKCGLIFPEAVF